MQGKGVSEKDGSALARSLYSIHCHPHSQHASTQRGRTEDWRRRTGKGSTGHSEMGWEKEREEKEREALVGAYIIHPTSIQSSDQFLKIRWFLPFRHFFFQLNLEDKRYFFNTLTVRRSEFRLSITGLLNLENTHLTTWVNVTTTGVWVAIMCKARG